MAFSIQVLTSLLSTVCSSPSISVLPLVIDKFLSFDGIVIIALLIGTPSFSSILVRPNFNDSTTKEESSINPFFTPLDLTHVLAST